MDITYLGHSSFKIKGKDAVVVTDPYAKEVGFAMPSVSADIVTVSHAHFDHNHISGVKGTTRRPEPFVIDAPGEYEIQGASVFGVGGYHDAKMGEERGKNTMFVVRMEGISVAHLGDLGHELTDKQVEELDGVDVLLCPVGGFYTIDPKQAAEVITMIQPSYVVPMHYRTEKHEAKGFGQLASVDDFLKELGVTEPKRSDKLVVTTLNLPEEMEVVVLEA